MHPPSRASPAAAKGVRTLGFPLPAPAQAGRPMLSSDQDVR